VQVAPNPHGDFLEDVVGVVPVAAQASQQCQDHRAMPVNEIQEDLPFLIHRKRSPRLGVGPLIRNDRPRWSKTVSAPEVFEKNQQSGKGLETREILT
jgi:hypothetical protein